MKIIVDVQGFKTSKTTFTPKELAVFDGVHISHYIFKAPFPFSQLPPDLQKQAEWLINNHHCIAWDEGFTPPHYFQNILRRLADAADDIYVKGKEKAKYIQSFTTKPIIELDEHPPLKPTIHQCFYHSKSKCICAMSNVQHLYYNYIMH